MYLFMYLKWFIDVHLLRILGHPVPLLWHLGAGTSYCTNKLPAVKRMLVKGQVALMGSGQVPLTAVCDVGTVVTRCVESC